MAPASATASGPAGTAAAAISDGRLGRRQARGSAPRPGSPRRRSPSRSSASKPSRSSRPAKSPGRDTAGRPPPAPAGRPAPSGGQQPQARAGPAPRSSRPKLGWMAWSSPSSPSACSAATGSRSRASSRSSLPIRGPLTVVSAPCPDRLAAKLRVCGSIVESEAAAVAGQAQQARGVVDEASLVEDPQGRRPRGRRAPRGMPVRLPASGWPSASAIALTVKSRRRRSSSSVAGSTSGSAPGRG